MTREEFDAGWNTLRGAGMRTSPEANEDVYYGALADLKSSLWAEMVSYVIRLGGEWLPSTSRMIEHAATVARAMRDARLDAKREQTCNDRGEPYLLEHSALPRIRYENGCYECPGSYAGRLAVKLGYMDSPAPAVHRMPDPPQIRLPYKDHDDDENDALWSQA